MISLNKDHHFPLECNTWLFCPVHFRSPITMLCTQYVLKYQRKEKSKGGRGTQGKLKWIGPDIVSQVQSAITP